MLSVIPLPNIFSDVQISQISFEKFSISPENWSKTHTFKFYTHHAGSGFIQPAVFWSP